MENGAGRGGIGIGRHDHLIPRADTQKTQIQLLRRRGGIKANHTVFKMPGVFMGNAVYVGLSRFYECSKTPFQQLCARAGGDPARTHRVRYLGDLELGNIGGTE